MIHELVSIIENIINTVNQYAYCIAQDIIKSNRDIIRVPKIGNISNNKTFQSNYSQSNQISSQSIQKFDKTYA